MAGVVRILSIDGGGIRGLIPALFLERLEQRVGAPVAEMFHLIAGTSTGGLIALGLTQPGSAGRTVMSGESAVNLYERRGAEIFDRSLWYGFSSLGGFTDAKYPPDILETVLEEELGNGWLSDAITDVFVTAYDVERRRPRFLKSWKARGELLRPDETAQSRDFLARDAARATSAAPTYFEPARTKARDAVRHCLVDGGVFANNPAMCALASARKRYPTSTQYLILSLGTGILERRIPCEEAQDWGLAGWARPIVNVIFDGVADTVDYQLRSQLPRRYYRYQCDLSKFEDGTQGPNEDLDGADSDNLRKLRRKADEMMANNAREMRGVVRQLKRPKDDIPPVQNL